MPLWYVVRERRPPGCGRGRSPSPRRTRNLERDPRATLQVEAGRRVPPAARRDARDRGDVLHRDIDVVAALGLEIFGRYAGGGDGELPDEVREMVRKQASKRVGLEFVERHRATWDHRKLGNVY